MQDTALMSVVDGAGHLGKQLRYGGWRIEDRGWRARPFSIFHPRASLFDVLGEIATLHQFHAVVNLPSMFANFVNRNDVRMIQSRRGAGLDLKALHERGAGEFSPGNH